MGIVVAVMMFAIIWVIKAAMGSASNSQGGYRSLSRNGMPARGILLSVSSMSMTSVGVGLNKLQVRQVRIDVEVPGQAPYETTANVAIPLNLVRDVLPGATVELRVDRKNPNNIAIVGPGVGFNSASLMTQGQFNQGAA